MCLAKLTLTFERLTVSCQFNISVKLMAIASWTVIKDLVIDSRKKSVHDFLCVL